ncbi:hypothetical protein B9Z35_05895 [Limnohabitans sp. Jir61]|uniref:YDG domain-containing protein n=1 Tax=Limnohabitans sp. Jir61 TaxID=1826168 RepID=UPI000D335C57|nr:YDG domain-containing protein [Limnohabitans sp. Jir61]PUE33053.1 hypothetical protein B9Z35_05895 [Limnohabitans sp. Jir61]
MNRNYRHVWSYITQSWHVAPETARRSGKGGGAKRAAAAFVGALALVTLGGVATLSHAQQAPPTTQLPTGASVMRGAASITQTGATMVVNQTTSNAVVNWSTFNVGANAQVNFNLPSSTSTTLNRVTGSNPSQIFGQITSNGQVFLVNPSGVYFAPSAQVDVGSLTATTHSISDDNFMTSKYQFERNGTTAKVVNEGKLTAALGGYIALLAPQVQNSGVVIAKAGTVAMAAGEVVTLNFSGSNSLAGISTTPTTIASLVENKLAVQAPDGQIILSAVALNKLQAGVVKNSGTLEANSLVSKGGKIVLEGDEITLATNSKIDASGATGGGTVLVGGEWQGGGQLRQATKVTMEAGSRIDANAINQGDGGQVVLWSDVKNENAQTVVAGAISTQAGAQGGQGGHIETSGHHLELKGQFQAGNQGHWLIDPIDLTVDASTANVINSALEANTAVSVQASTVATCTVSCTNTVAGGGNLYVNAPLTWTTNASLTLSASNNIYIAAPITSSGTTASLNLFYGGSTASSAPSAGTYYRLDMTNAGSNYISMTGSGAQLKIGNQSYTLLQSIADLQLMAATGGYYALGQSLNTPATYTNAVYAGNFQGSFDGLGNTVSGIRLVNSCTSTCNIGFFAQASNGAKISNLLLNEIFTLTGPSTGSATYSNYAVGGLVGRVTGGTSAAPNTFSGNGITFVQNTSNVSTLSINGYWGGGIIGQTYGASAVYSQISNSVASLNVNNTNVLGITASSIGGIVGDASASTSGSAPGSGGQINISSTYVSGNIQVKQAGYWGVGGLIGQAYGTPVVANNSYTYFEPGSLTSTSGTISVGGLMGWAPSLTLTNSYSTYGSNASSNSSTHVYYGTSLTGNNTLLPGLDASYWQLSGGAIVLKNLPVPSPAPGVPIYVYETVTNGFYGNLTFSYSLYDGSLTQVVQGPSLNVSGVAAYNINNSTDAGTYSIKYVSGLVLGGTMSSGYSLYAYPSTYTIQKAPLQVSVNSDAKAQGQVDTPGYAGVSYSGFVNGQSSAALGGTLAIARNTNPPDGSTVVNGSPNSESIGTFTGALTASGLTSKNYDFAYVPGNYQILPANQLVVRVANQTASYGSTPTYSLSSVQYFDSVSQSTVDLTSRASLSGSVVTVTDPNGGSEQFSLVPQSPNTSSASHSLVTGTYQLGASGISNSSTLSSPTVIGSLTVMPTAITPSLTQAPSKAYDGARTLNFNNLSFNLSGLVPNDVVSLGGTGLFASKTLGAANVGYTLSGLTLSGADAANYYLPSASTSITGSNGTITAAPLGISLQAVYSGATTVTPTSYTLTGLVGGDAAATLTSVVVNNKNVSSANLVSSLVLSNGAQGNYVLNTSSNTSLGTNTTNTVTLSRAPLGVSATAVYSGSTVITPTSLTMTGLVGVDVGATASNVTMNSKDVGVANRISSLTLSTGDEANYTLNSSAYTPAGNNTTNTVTLSQKALSLTGATVANSKVYDGTTSASVTGTPALLASEAVGTGSSADGVPYTSDAVILSVSSLAANYNAATVASANTITLSGLSLSSSNYKLQTYSGSITKAPLGISASAVYANSTTVTPTSATLYGLVPIDAAATVSSMVIDSASVASASSITSLTLSNSSQANYQLNVGANTTPSTNTTNTLTLTRKALTISSGAVTSKVYDGTTSASLTGTLNGVLGADVVSLSTLSGTFASSDVGNGIAVTPSYAITGTGAANYSLTQPTGLSGAITAKALTISSPLVTTKVYDGTTTAALTGTLNGVIPADTLLVNLSTLTGTYASFNAGSGIAVTPSYAISGTKASNYSLTQPVGMTGTIVTKDLTISNPLVTTKVYDGTTTAALTGTLNGVIAADASFVSLSTLTGTFASANAGTGIAVTPAYAISGTKAANYSLIEPTGMTGGINKALLTLTTSDVVKVYNGTTSVAGASIAPSLVVTSGTLYANASNGGVTDAISGGTFAFTDANAGTNNKTVSVSGVTINDGNAGGNYTVSYLANTHSTINKAPLTLSTADVVKVYDGATSVAGASTAPSLVVTSGTLYANASNGGVTDAISGGTFAFTDANAGTNNKTVSVSGVTVSDGNAGGNYTVSYAANTHSTINKAPLTLSTSDVVKVYDGTTSVVGASTAPSLVVTNGTLYANASNGGVTDAISGGTFAFTDANAGTNNKTVSVSGVTVSDGNAGGNYTVSYAANTHSTINKAPLTLTTSDVVKVYDGTTSVAGASTAPSLVVTSGTLYNNASNGGVLDSISGGTFTLTDANAGTNNKTVSVSGITVSDGNAGGNYTVSYAANTHSTINKAPLTVTGDSSTQIYNGLSQMNTYSVNGLQGTDTANSIGLSLSGLASGTNVGTYADSLSVGTLSNYNISTVNNSLTIHPLPVSLSGTKNFDGTSLLNTSATGSTLSVRNAVANTSVNVVGRATLASAAPGNQGVVDFNSLTLDNPNYTLAGASGTVNVVDTARINVQPLTLAETSVLVGGGQLKALTAAQIGLFDTVQLQVFTPEIINALSSEQLAGLSVDQLNSLSQAQVAGIDPSQVAFLTTTQIENLSAEQFANFTPQQLQAMTLAQVAVMSEPQLKAMSPQQIAALSWQQLAAMTPKQLALIGKTPTANDAATQMGQLRQMSGLQVRQITPAQLSELTPEQIKALVPSQLQALTTQQLSALSPTQVVAITPAQLSVMSQRQRQILVPVDVALNESNESSIDAPEESVQEPESTESNPRSPDREPSKSKLTLVMVANTGAMESLPEVFSSFTVLSSSGKFVEFEGGLENNHIVIVVQNDDAKDMVRDEMPLVLTAALETINASREEGQEILLTQLDGWKLDFRLA